MGNDIRIPEEAVLYILLQRGGSVRGKTFSKIEPLVRPFVKNIRLHCNRIEAKIQREHISNSFNQVMISEFNNIRSVLPKNVASILDVGCGVGGIDALLHQHYGYDDTIHYVMLDKSSINDGLYFGFREHGAYYNSLQVTRSLLVENEIREQNISLIEPFDDYKIQIPNSLKIDLVISLISWGFHYPVSTYLDQVYEIMNDGGCLILDIRKGTNGLDELRNHFSQLKVISQNDGKSRILAMKGGLPE